eukprot:scaffold113462_cov16-Prasinocladus_malaysianus.AAC.1
MGQPVTRSFITVYSTRTVDTRSDIVPRLAHKEAFLLLSYLAAVDGTGCRWHERTRPGQSSTCMRDMESIPPCLRGHPTNS